MDLKKGMSVIEKALTIDKESKLEESKLEESKIEEELPLSRNLLLSLQHVLLMNAYVVPVIIASMLNFTDQGASSIIQSTFLASGLTTFLQSKYLMKYPVVYGASFVPIGAIAGIYFINGGTPEAWSVVVGACLIGALTALMLGISNTFNKILDHLIPPIVGATVVLCIGLSLIPLALSSQIFVENGLSMGGNTVVALVTIAAMVLFSFLGNTKGKLATIFRVGSGILALLTGYVVANMLGTVDLTVVKNASLISRPALPFVDFGIQFDVSSILTMVVLYLILMTETIGTWLATSSATKTELTDERVNKGVIGLGVSNIIAALLGTTPMSGYSSNVGILTLTDTFSRHVTKFVGLILIVIGFSNKLSAFISVIPSAAIGGIFLITSGIITVAGINMYKSLDMGMKGNYVVSISVIVALALNMVPEGALEALPVMMQYILGSSIASAALVAIVLNKLLPEM